MGMNWYIRIVVAYASHTHTHTNTITHSQQYLMMGQTDLCTIYTYFKHILQIRYWQQEQKLLAEVEHIFLLVMNDTNKQTHTTEYYIQKSMPIYQISTIFLPYLKPDPIKERMKKTNVQLIHFLIVVFNSNLNLADELVLCYPRIIYLIVLLNRSHHIPCSLCIFTDSLQ